MRSADARVLNYFAECAGDLTLLGSMKLIASSSTSPTYVNGSIVHSRYAWCANTAATTEYIKVDLGEIRRVTGFGIQGDSENDKWPTKIKIGVSNSSSAPGEMAKVILLTRIYFIFSYRIGLKVAY